MEQVQFLQGECREVLRTLPAGSVHCVVTSPPYLSLRDYGVEPSIWGGSSECDHEWGRELKAVQAGGGLALGGNLTGGDKDWQLGERSQGQVCQKCGAWKGCLGLEPTVSAYVAHLVEVFEEVRRVLHPEGVVWLNLGDSYFAGKRAGPSAQRSNGGLERHAHIPDVDPLQAGSLKLKPKDLIGVPWRVALALQEAGWYLRSDCIWQKVNPRPSSTRDRPSPDHEYVFMLTKRHDYYYDEFAVRQPTANGTGLRRLRTVWRIATQPTKDAHFATFPLKLVELAVRAGTSERGACPTCGAQYVRLTEKGEPNRAHQRACGGDDEGEYRGQNQKDYAGAGVQAASDLKRRILERLREEHTVGWSKACKCARATPVPSVVLDCFGGSGATAVAATRLGRRVILVEQNPAYVEIARARVARGK